MANPKLSIVIVCWNDKGVILDAIASVIRATHLTAYEIIVSDNGSTDDSVEQIETMFADHPVTVIRNGENLGFGRGNNVGIDHATGDYILLLNPDTIVHDHALDQWVQFADAHPGCGAFGIRLVYGDGSYQVSARPFPSNRRIWQQAFGLNWLGLLHKGWSAGTYAGWQGDSDRDIDWQSGACLLVRGEILKKLKGLDPQFFYHFEEVDLCYRIHQEGFCIRYFSGASITHLLGQTIKRDRSRFQIETLRNRIRYFDKHYGMRGASLCRLATFFYFTLRYLYDGFFAVVMKDAEALIKYPMALACCRWLWHLNPRSFISNGDEPDLGFLPLVEHETLVLAHEEWIRKTTA